MSRKTLPNGILNKESGAGGENRLPGELRMDPLIHAQPALSVCSGLLLALVKTARSPQILEATASSICGS